MRTTQGITVCCLLCISYLLLQNQECYVKVMSQVPRLLFFFLSLIRKTLALSQLVLELVAGPSNSCNCVNENELEPLEVLKILLTLMPKALFRLFATEMTHT